MESSPSETSSSLLTPSQRYRARKKAIEQGKDPDRVAPKVKIGRPPTQNPSASTIRVRAKRLREEAASIGLVIPKLPAGRPRMNTLYNFMTGGSGKEPTEAERFHSQMGEVLRQYLKDNSEQTALEKQESDRRLLEAQATAKFAESTAKFAQATLEREQSAHLDAKNRAKRIETLAMSYQDFVKSTPSKKKQELGLDDNDVEEAKPSALVPPSPARAATARTPSSTRKPSSRSTATARTPSSRSTATARSRSSSRKPSSRSTAPKRIKNLEDTNEILSNVSVKLIWDLSFDDFAELSRSCWILCLFEDACSPKKRKKLGGDVLRAFCQRLDKECVELNHEDCDQDHDFAKLLDDYFDDLAAKQGDTHIESINE